MGDWFPKQTLGSLPGRAARRWGAREALYFKGRRSSFKELAPSLRGGTVREDRFKHLRLVVSAGDEPRAETLHWAAAQAAGDAVDEVALRARAEAVDPDATAFFMYTSGTTGFPKG